MGALDPQSVVHQHQGWRLISCMWLHAGVFHGLANMLSLIFIGIRLEQEFGFVQIGFLYLMSGFGGSLLSALFIQYGISVGASGALFGLLGSLLLEPISNWTMYVNKEFGIGSEALITGYVYSFGMLLLEMFTRKRPTDNVFDGDLNPHVTIFNQCSRVLSPHEV